MKTRLIIVAVLLFFSLLAMLHFSLPVKGIEEPNEDEVTHHDYVPPKQSGSGPGYYNVTYISVQKIPYDSSGRTYGSKKTSCQSNDFRPVSSAIY